MSNRFSKKNSLPPDKCPHCKIYTGDKFSLGFRSHVRFCSTTNFKNKKKSRSHNVDQLDSLNLSVNNNLSSVNESLVDREDFNQNVMESSPLFQMSPRSTSSPQQLHRLVEENNHFEDNFDNDNDNFDQTGVPSTQIIDELYRTKYLKWQYKIQDLLYNSNNNDGDDSNQSSSNNLSNSLRLGWVYDVTKTRRGVPNTLDLLELFTFVKQNWLSNDKGDALLQVVTQIVLRHPTKDYLFLYKKFISINAAVSKAVNELYSLYDYNILLPDKLRGSNNTEKTSIKRILDSRNQNPEFIIAKGSGLDIIQIISEYCITIECDKFDFEPEITYDKNGERIYSRFVTADLYSHIFHETHIRYGEDVTPICIQLNYDATDVSSGGGSAPKSLTPLHVRVLNVSDEIFPLQASTILAGFAPLLSVSIYIFFIYFF